MENTTITRRHAHVEYIDCQDITATRSSQDISVYSQEQHYIRLVVVKTFLHSTRSRLVVLQYWYYLGTLVPWYYYSSILILVLVQL